MKRTIVTTSICSHYNKELETTLHALWYCEKITPVWQQAFGVLNSIFYSLTFFVDLLDLVSSSHLNPNLFAMICWLIWQRRNKTQVREPVLPLANIAATTRDNLREFQSLQLKPHDTSRPRRKVWKPPDTNTCKTNFDKTMFKDLNKAGIGVVVQNSQGEVMAAMSEKIIMPPSVVILETIAAR